MGQLLSNEVRQKIEDFLEAKIDIKEFNTISKIYSIIAGSIGGTITINVLAQRYGLLTIDEVHAIIIILNKVGVVSIECKKTIAESIVKIARKETVEMGIKRNTEIKPAKLPVIINEGQMNKAKNLLKMPNGISLAKLLENLGLQQNPANIKALLGRLKAKFNLVVRGNPENPESYILKIER